MAGCRCLNDDDDGGDDQRGPGDPPRWGRLLGAHNIEEERSDKEEMAGDDK